MIRWDADKPWPHSCACWSCRPGRFPKIPESPDADYVGVDSVYHRPVPTWAGLERAGPGSPVRQLDVYLNGRLFAYQHPVEGERAYAVIELLAGAPGWIIFRDYDYDHGSAWREGLVVQGHFRCPCGSGLACHQVAFGHVAYRVRGPGEPRRRFREVAPGVWAAETEGAGDGGLREEIP